MYFIIIMFLLFAVIDMTIVASIYATRQPPKPQWQREMEEAQFKRDMAEWQRHDEWYARMQEVVRRKRLEEQQLASQPVERLR